MLWRLKRKFRLKGDFEIMSDNTGDETNTLFGRSMTRGKRILASALGCAVLVAVIVWGAWLAHKRGAFSAVWEKWQVARQGPAWDSLVASGFVLLALLALVALWKGPQWQVGHLKNLDLKERFDRENEARKTLATILGGIVLLTGGFFTWQNFNLAREGQITDRYSKAIEQLGARDADGKVRLEIRLGGIYALERIANESESDRWPIVEVLCTYVRAHAPWKQENSLGEEQKSWALEPNEEKEVVASSPLSADIQSILTVLGRRNRRYETKDEQLDLHDTDLRGAILRRDFSGANLSGSNLTGANLIGVNLSGANLNTMLPLYSKRPCDCAGNWEVSPIFPDSRHSGRDRRRKRQ
jgi:hypothetical protein